MKHNSLTISITSVHATPGDEPVQFVLSVARPPNDAAQCALLDWLFSHLNRVGPGSGHLIDIIEMPLPSLSIGDRIQMDFRTPQGASATSVWWCDSLGWTTIAP